jgi:hypothetical protein
VSGRPEGLHYIGVENAIASCSAGFRSSKSTLSSA